MNTNKEKSSQEIPTREFLAKEAKDFLFYAAQEGTAEDVQDFYKGLDIEKILAFIEEEKENLNRLPAVIAMILLNDNRKEVKEALKANPAIFEHPNFFTTVEDWGKMHGLTPEEVVKSGRKCVAKIMNRVSGIGRQLRSEEVKAIKNMASNIPDPKVLDALFPLAEKDADIAGELVLNPAMTPEHIDRIINISLKGIENDDRWVDILIELLARHYKDMDESMKSKLNGIPAIETYMEIFSKGSKPKIQMQMSNGKGKKRLTPNQRKAARTEKKERRKALFDDEGFAQATA